MARTMTGLRVVPLSPALADASVALFAACASSCFCRYWHFEGPKNDWLARLAFSPETNEAEHRGALASGDDSAAGLVALEGDTAVGWLKLAPRSRVPKLRRLPVYRSLDLGPEDEALSIACALVHPDHRRRGVARALVTEAIVQATERGARVLEAYPHRRSEPLGEEELWMGPFALYEELGFTVAAGDGPYPVLRRLL